MRNLKFLMVLMCASMMFSTSLLADQDSDTDQADATELEDNSSTGEAVHPYLNSKYQVSFGMYFPSKDFTIKVDGIVPGSGIDFQEDAGLSDTDEILSAAFRWNFGQKWSFWAQYFQSEADRTAVLTEDVEWEDVIFREGTNISAGTSFKVARFFFGREFKTGPNYEFGAGLGFHWLEIGAFIEGQAFINDDSTEFYRGDADASFPLPDIGAWYSYAFNERWLFMARADWLSASIGDYSGSLTDVAAGINYSFTDHLSVNLSYYMFRVNVDIDKNDWKGSADLNYDGPYLSVIFSF